MAIEAAFFESCQQQSCPEGRVEGILDFQGVVGWFKGEIGELVEPFAGGSFLPAVDGFKTQDVLKVSEGIDNIVSRFSGEPATIYGILETGLEFGHS